MEATVFFFLGGEEYNNEQTKPQRAFRYGLPPRSPPNGLQSNSDVFKLWSGGMGFRSAIAERKPQIASDFPLSP